LNIYDTSTFHFSECMVALSVVMNTVSLDFWRGLGGGSDDLFMLTRVSSFVCRCPAVRLICIFSACIQTQTHTNAQQTHTQLEQQLLHLWNSAAASAAAATSQILVGFSMCLSDSELWTQGFPPTSFYCFHTLSLGITSASRYCDSISLIIFS